MNWVKAAPGKILLSQDACVVSQNHNVWRATEKSDLSDRESHSLYLWCWLYKRLWQAEETKEIIL